MRIIRSTDTHPRQRIVRSHLLGAKTIKLLIFRKKGTIWKTSIQTSHRVKFIIRNHQIITSIGNRFDMTWRYITRSANKGKILHKNILFFN